MRKRKFPVITRKEDGSSQGIEAAHFSLCILLFLIKCLGAIIARAREDIDSSRAGYTGNRTLDAKGEERGYRRGKKIPSDRGVF